MSVLPGPLILKLVFVFLGSRHMKYQALLKMLYTDIQHVQNFGLITTIPSLKDSSVSVEI